MWPTFGQLRSKLRHFAENPRGNVAVTFGIATLPVIGAVGAAVDLSRGNSLQAALQSAVDATGLYVSQQAATATADQLQTAATNSFGAVFTRPEAKNTTITASYSSSGGSSVFITATTKLDTQFMGILGYKEMTISATATVRWGSERLRVALALDNTGSMASDGKMDALKSATKSLLTQLKNAASTNGDVYVSIIPFSKDVSVDPITNYNANWIDWREWEDNHGSCSGYSGRRRPRTKSSCESDDGTWTPANHNTWNGCIMDRGNVSAPHANEYDRKVTPPDPGIAASKFPAENYANCPVPMMGQTYDWNALNTLVDGMIPTGNTNQPIGLVWGWQSLVGGGPLAVPAKDPNYTYKDYIILMSDGLNTENRWSTSQTSVDRRMYDSSNGGVGTCANAKAAGITIYTIHVNTGGDPTSTLLRNCASSSDKFWEVKTAGDLGTVFTKIGTNLTKLRVAQ
jgi:Flp pilus assembly protein TadG